MGSGCGIHPPGHTPLSVPYSHTVIFLLSGGPTPQHHLAPLLWATFHANWTSVQCAFSSACLRRHFSFSAPTQFSNNTTRIFCPPIPLTARQEVWLVTSITSILGIPTTLTSQLLLHASHGALSHPGSKWQPWAYPVNQPCVQRGEVAALEAGRAWEGPRRPPSGKLLSLLTCHLSAPLNLTPISPQT